MTTGMAEVDRSPELLSRVASNRPTAVFVGKGALRYEEEILEKKFTLWSSEMTAEVIGVGRRGRRSVGGVRVIRFPELHPPALGGLIFYTAAPLVAMFRALRHRAAAIICQSPLEGFVTVATGRIFPRKLRPLLIVELHGDWRSATELYGHPVRKRAGSLVARLGRWTLRRADLVRAVSGPLEDLARSSGYTGEILRFPTYSDYDAFTSGPPAAFPISPRVAFIGSLEASKGVDVLVEAWPAVVEALPESRLSLVGDGGMRLRLEKRVADFGLSGVQFLGMRSPTHVREMIDDSSLVVLPSRTEGLPRVIPETFARGRPVIATDVGGIPELVEEGRTGLLVPPDDAGALAEALIFGLRDQDRLAAMGANARQRVLTWDPMGRYRDGMRSLSEWLQQGGGDR